MFILEARSQQEVQAWTNTDIVITKFSATWCRPCKVLHKTLMDSSKDELFDRVTILEVDLDDSEFDDLKEEHKVQSIPYLVVEHRNGKKETVTGNNIEELRNIIQRMKTE